MLANLLPRMQMSRLTIVIIAVAFVATAGLLGYAGFSSGDNTVSVYGTDNSDALELRGSVFAKCGADDSVEEVMFTVAIPEGASPVNFSAPPGNVVNISYSDNDQQIDEVLWKVKEYVAGDGDIMLESGETFLITVLPGEVLNHDLGAGAAFVIEVRTPGDEVLTIKRTTPDYLEPVMNLE